jgi:hypothetical protein
MIDNLRIKIIWIVSIWLCFLPLQAFTPNESAIIIIQSGEVLRADFEQSRYLAALPTPIKSNGYIELWGSKGLIWHTAQPFTNSLIISKQGIFKIDEKQQKVTLASAQMPKDNRIFECISKVLAGSFAENLQDFDVTDLPSDKGWKVKLTPSNVHIKKIIAYIEVSGKKFIDKIILYRPNHDYEVIILHNHQIKAANELMWLYD